MFKKWLTRFAVVSVIGAAMSAGITSPAYAADTWLLLSDVDGHQVAYMVHEDPMDVFVIGDTRRDNYGPTGCVQQYVTYIGWQNQMCAHLSSGAGRTLGMHYPVVEGLKYRMRLCHKIAGCAYKKFTE